MGKGGARAAVASLVAVTLLATAPARGQAAPAPWRDTFWIGGGLGVGSEDAAGSLNGSYQFGASLVTLRATITAGILGDDGFGDYALLYGRATRPATKQYHLSAAAGVGLVHGCRGGGLSSCRDVPSVIGFPIELQAFWRPGSLIALGIYGFANLNQEQSFAGVTLGLQLGRLH